MVDSHIVTSATIRDAMRSAQGKAAHVVIEGRLGPEILGVTLSAEGQLSLMMIVFEVTGNALLT